MAGGTFTSQNKVRPGAYINIEGRQMTVGSDDAEGIVLLPMSLDWGPTGEIIEVDRNTSFLKTFGKLIGSPELVTLKEALKNANTVKVVRLGSGVTAKSGVDSKITVEALYPGTVGNDLNVKAVMQEAMGDTYLQVKTYLRYEEAGESTESEVYSQMVKLDKDEGDKFIIPHVDNFKDNPYVAISAITELPSTLLNIVLSGGTSVEGTSEESLALVKQLMETTEFNFVAWTFSEDISELVPLVKTLREDEGKKVQLVVGAPIPADSAVPKGYDYEGVIQIANGIVLEDGTELSPYQATAWVAGASAKASVSYSLTYAVYDNSVEATPKYSDSKTKELLQAGYLLFTDKRGVAVVEQDINSLVTLTSKKGQEFTKNRVLRTLDFFANDSKKDFEDYFIGQVNNTVDGRELFKANRIKACNDLQGKGAIESFTPADLVIEAGEQHEGVVLYASIKPVESMEKLYMTIKVV